MDYRQESVATLHDFGSADPPAPLSETAVVVPLTERDFEGREPEPVFASLAGLPVARVIVPLRAPADAVGRIQAWLDGFDADIDVLWCNAPSVEELLATAGLDGNAGKGRDVWLGLGLASRAEYVVLHDADVRSHEPGDIRKLAAPLAVGYDFVKGYYARVEDRRLYGRLVRLFVAPLLDALDRTQDGDVIRFLQAFRYPLAGEMAMTADMATRIRAPRRWGFEIGTLGDAFREAGFDGSAQVDLGLYEHEHRAVTGPTGLSDMSHGVARAIFHVLEDHGIHPDLARVRAAFLESADRLVDQYAADAWFNALSFDEAAERDQVERYADAIVEPEPTDRLPAWERADISVADLEATRMTAVDGIH